MKVKRICHLSLERHREAGCPSKIPAPVWVTLYTPPLTGPAGSPFDDNTKKKKKKKQLYEYKAAGKKPPLPTQNPQGQRNLSRGHGDEAGSDHANTNSSCGSSESDQRLGLSARPTGRQHRSREHLLLGPQRAINEKWLPLISIHWPLQIAMIGHASHSSPSVKTSLSANRVTWSANLLPALTR